MKSPHSSHGLVDMPNKLFDKEKMGKSILLSKHKLKTMTIKIN
jgi:hypothetical protein